MKKNLYSAMISLAFIGIGTLFTCCAHAELKTSEQENVVPAQDEGTGDSSGLSLEHETQIQADGNRLAVGSLAGQNGQRRPRMGQGNNAIASSGQRQGTARIPRSGQGAQGQRPRMGQGNGGGRVNSGNGMATSSQRQGTARMPRSGQGAQGQRPRMGQGGGNGRQGMGAAEGLPADPPPELVNDRNLHREVFSSEHGKMNYCEFLENADADGPMSLVLVLHGMSNRGSDNLKQLASPSVKPLLDYLRKNKIKALVLIPQCPEDIGWVRSGEISMLDILSDLVDVKRKKYDISSERSIITGFSMGGGGCFFFMMQHPGVFSRALVVSAGGMPEWGSRMHGDFFIAVGSEDKLVSVDNAEKLAQTLSLGNKVRFEKLPGKDHIETSQIIYADEGWKWAFNFD